MEYPLLPRAFGSRSKISFCFTPISHCRNEEDLNSADSDRGLK